MGRGGAQHEKSAAVGAAAAQRQAESVAGRGELYRTYGVAGGAENASVRGRLGGMSPARAPKGRGMVYGNQGIRK